jgi:hypothetical protein
MLENRISKNMKICSNLNDRRPLGKMKKSYMNHDVLYNSNIKSGKSSNKGYTRLQIDSFRRQRCMEKIIH